MQKEKLLNDSKLTKVYRTNHIVEAITIQKRCTSISNYRKVGKNGCVNLKTGEYIENKPRASLADIEKRFKKSSNELRRIINLNFTGASSEKFLTLTYAYLISDYQQVNYDFKNFWSKFRYYYPMCEYIRIIEPQESGKYHIHILIKRMDNQKLFVPHEEILKMWTNGNAWIENLPFADNFGAYFCPKFIKGNEAPDDINSKAYEKGKRIEFYPPKFNLYSCSKGIQKPTPTTMTYGDFKEIVGDTAPCYYHTTKITDKNDESKVLNTITYEQYNLKRKADKK